MSSSTPFHLLALQLDLRWQQPDANRTHIRRWVENYVGEADLILLPEMFTTGFTMEAEAWAEPVDGPTCRWMQELAQERGCLVGGSVITQEQGKCYNRFLLAEPTGSVAHYDKRHTFRMAQEHEHYQAGQRRVVVDYQGWRMLLLTCYDLRFPVWSRNRRQDDHMDYDLILCVANWPAARGSQWQALLTARAIENQCYVVGVNRVGQDGNEVAYAGGSMIIDPLGRPLATAAHQETLLLGQLDRAQLEQYRRQFPVWMDADSFTLT
jgi:predicted amidohydrolase